MAVLVHLVSGTYFVSNFLTVQSCVTILVTGLPNPVIKCERGCVAKLRNRYQGGIACVLRFRCVYRLRFRTIEVIEEYVLGRLATVLYSVSF